MKLMFKKIITNSTILSIPGFLGILISLISIPIHLNIAGPENYGNYIFFHFILTISIILNFGIGKSTVISINNYPKFKKKICFEALYYTKYILKIFLSICLLIFSIDHLIYNLNLNYSFFFYFISGSIMTVIFVTLEGILQGYRKFKFISMMNLFFFSFSFSFPSILLFYYENLNLNNLILISIGIKFFSILIMYIFIENKNLVINIKSNILYINLKKNSKWITLNGILIQFYDLFDKYLIKFFLGPVALTTYSIPQQLTGKLTIISKSFSAFLLPDLSKKQSDNQDFEFSLRIFIKIVPIFIFVFFPIFPAILELWLGNSYDEKIYSLTKIFSLSVILSCASHILITKFEAKKLLNQNLKIELILMPFFLLILFFFTSNNFTLFSISILILFKELILFFLRINFFKKQIKRVYTYYFFPIAYLILLTFSFLSNLLFYSLLIILFLTVVKK